MPLSVGAQDDNEWSRISPHSSRTSEEVEIARAHPEEASLRPKYPYPHFTWPGIQTASQTLLRASPLRGQKLGLLSRHVDVSSRREIGLSPGVEELPTENIC